jgi:hypothetical protein
LPFEGTLLAESLREGAKLEGIPLLVRAIRRADIGDPSVGQPRLWTLIEFEIADEAVTALAEALSVALAPGPWYCDLRSDEQTVVVFADRIFRYPRGDQTGRESAEAHARGVGVPDAQIDWPA